ncbi:MAG: hypothetical protein B6244_00950 [Candidatus Cloacimonetes bacterium 4572_55]|nr:MAG: hypothetical protein B6244_00950 [Candidatus Cloacimonetes bacterium 4572_55]
MAKILGVNLSHYGSAAVVIDGRIVAAVGEERINRIKNWAGFPKNAIHEVLRIAGVSAGEIDEIAVGTRCEIFIPNKAQDKEYRPLTRLISFLSRFIPTAILGSHLSRQLYVQIVSRSREKEYRNAFQSFFRDLGVPDLRIHIYDHHTCHAAAAHFLKPWEEKTLVFTNDGLGDGLCATVSIGDHNGFRRQVEITAIHSIGGIYSRTTRFLGLRPWNDEYKVMGLAPYANPTHAAPVVDFFRRFFVVKNREFRFQINHLGEQFIRFLNKNLENTRFDHIALGLQTMAEEVVCQWVRANIEHTGISRIAFAGGVGLNVKINKAVGELKNVRDMFVFPAAGDDSISIGAALLADRNLTEQKGDLFLPKKLTHLYLGTDAADDLHATLGKMDPNSYRITRSHDPNSAVAELLAQGEIIARCAGPMEYGPRALGNRSILSDPSRLENVRLINQAIKNRDFWMPFAPIILDRCADSYLINPKKLRALYMVHAFETRPERRHEIHAAIHQADATARPQILECQFNPLLYDLLEKFEQKTGIGALLNTSFNLHGFPIVRTSQDAVAVMEKSGLRYLLLCDYLIEKLA